MRTLFFIHKTYFEFPLLLQLPPRNSRGNSPQYFYYLLLGNINTTITILPPAPNSTLATDTLACIWPCGTYRVR